MLNSPLILVVKRKKKNWEEDQHSSQLSVLVLQGGGHGNSYSIPPVIGWKMNEPALVGRDG